jgi:hypothetical protein
MKRKLLSFAIAFALLSQTMVFAGPLTTSLDAVADLPLKPNSGTVSTTVQGWVKGSGDSAYSSVQTEYQNFDYKASIDMSNVLTKFNAFYGIGSDMSAPYTSDYENSIVTGKFYVTFLLSTGLSQSASPTTALAALALPATSIFKITNIDTNTANTVVVTAEVKDPDTGNADLTVKKLNDNKGTYLNSFELGIDSLVASANNQWITVSMKGDVYIGETDEPGNPYAQISFDSNSSTVNICPVEDTPPVVSPGGSGGSGNTEPTVDPTEPVTDDTIVIGEDGSIEVGDLNIKENTTTEEQEDGSVIEQTVAEGSGSEKNKDGSVTDTDYKREVVKETAPGKDTPSKVTVIETTVVTETAKDGTKTTTTTVKETVKETDEKTGVTNITTSEKTEAPAESNALIGAITTTADVTRKITVAEKPEEKKGFIENGWSTTPYGAGDKDYDGTSSLEATVTEVTVTETSVLVDENGDPILDADGNEQLVTTVTTTSYVPLYPKYVNVTVPDALEQEKDENGNPLHKVYIYGYPDGEVKPNDNITREEITAAFDRLLNVAFRATIATTEQDFPDVNNSRWSNDSIATMANGGFIVGDENGNFNPSKPITRAEFAVIAAKFAPVDAEIAENYFTDIEGHWAKDFILKIAGQYWISGNPDGTFNPDAPITRAEAMTIINRMLVRYGDGDADNATEWPDVDKSDWYYEQVIEATTHNVYERTANGWSEKWVDAEGIEEE